MTLKKRGRKTILNAKLERQICDLLADGVPIGATCDCVSIAPSTFHQWVQRGESGEPKFADFSEGVTRARGQARAKLVRLVTKAAETDWRAAIALLERVYPSEFARVERVEAQVSPQPTPMAFETYLCYDGRTERVEEVNGQPGRETN
jgi:hypothetical protein